MSDLIAIYRRIAYENITKEIKSIEDFEKAICQWWRRKYKIPDTDPRYLDKYVHDMIVEYFEDQFREDPQFLHAYKLGFDSFEEVEESRLKQIMGTDYTEEISYLQEPNKTEMTSNQSNESVEEEVVVTF